MAHRIINNEAELMDFVRFIGKLKLPVTFEWVLGRDRTKDQNALQWLWASEAANQLGDRTPDEIQREWKLRHGVPILREDSAEFRDIYDRLLKPRTYAEKVDAMRFIDVTSAMKVRQMVRFLDAVQRECLEQGLRLTDPDPELASYQSRYRQKDIAPVDTHPKGGDRRAPFMSGAVPEGQAPNPIPPEDGVSSLTSGAGTSA